MGFNDYLDPLVKVKGATSISIIFLVDGDVRSSPPYIFVPAPWPKHSRTTIRGDLVWEFLR